MNLTRRDIVVMQAAVVVVKVLRVVVVVVVFRSHFGSSERAALARPRPYQNHGEVQLSSDDEHYNSKRDAITHTLEATRTTPDDNTAGLSDYDDLAATDYDDLTTTQQMTTPYLELRAKGYDRRVTKRADASSCILLNNNI